MSSKKASSTVETVDAATECLNEIQGNMREMPKIRDLTRMKVNTVYRQGDIYILKVEKTEKGEEIQNSRQLVDGLTKGSRHCITEGPKIFKLLSKAPRGGVEGNDVLRQPACVIEALAEFTVHHPEHASAKMSKGTYEVWHQMDYQRQQKVRD